MENPLNPGYFTEAELSRFGFRSLGSNVRIAKSCTIPTPSKITIGSNVRIDGPTTITGTLTLGSYIHIGGTCFLIGGSGITFEDFTTISHGVKIFTGSDDYSGAFMTNPTVPEAFTGVERGPVVLHKHVVVGAGSVILPSVTLGEGSAVGALSLIKKGLAPWGIYAGVPARRIRDRSRGLLELEQKLAAVRLHA